MDKLPEDTAPQASYKASAVAVVLTCLTVMVVLAIALEPFVTLHWALAHPKSYTKHDPHHWLARLALLSIAFTVCQALWRGIRQSWKDFRNWQQAFLPMPWDRPEQQIEAELPEG